MSRCLRVHPLTCGLERILEPKWHHPLQPIPRFYPYHTESVWYGCRLGLAWVEKWGSLKINNLKINLNIPKCLTFRCCSQLVRSSWLLFPTSAQLVGNGFAGLSLVPWTSVIQNGRRIPSKELQKPGCGVQKPRLQSKKSLNNQKKVLTIRKKS